MDHPNIMKLIDCVETSDHICLITEYCEHGDLSDYVADKAPLPEDIIRELTRQLGTHSHTHLLTHSLTRSLTHSLTHSLSHTHTHSTAYSGRPAVPALQGHCAPRPEATERPACGVH
jgi:serine/threonine protein kinase